LTLFTIGHGTLDEATFVARLGAGRAWISDRKGRVTARPLARLYYRRCSGDQGTPRLRPAGRV